MFNSPTSHVDTVDSVMLYIIIFSSVLLLGIISAMVFFVFKFNRKKGYKPVNIHGNALLETIWIVIPTLIAISMFFYGYMPHLTGFLILPLLVLITFIAALGLGLFLSALNVKYRDVRYILPFFIQLMLFITPVIYPASITGIWSWFLAMNPMTGVIKAARAALLGNFPINWELLGISTLACIAILIFGYFYFKKTEEYFADIV